jgi:hypothetical protein
MALTTTLDTNTAATKSISVTYLDAFGATKSFAAGMVTTMDKTALDALLLLIEPCTNAKICEARIDREVYTMTGGEAAANAVFPDVYDRAELEFGSGSRCGQIARYSVLAPVAAMFQDINGKKVLDPSNVAVAALASWLAAHLKSSNYGGLTDWTFVGGRRWADPLPDCIVG